MKIYIKRLDQKQLINKDIIVFLSIKKNKIKETK